MERIATARVTEEEEVELITGEELLEQGDVGRCELVKGVIIEMSPTGLVHSVIESNVDFQLRKFLEKNPLGVVGTGEGGIYTDRDPDTVRGADVFFISHERYAQLKRKGFLDIAPELVVEVLSPSDTWSEITTKLGEYFDAGVNMIWVIDSNRPQVFVYRSLTDVRHFTEGDILPGDEILPGLELPVALIYEDVN